MTWNDLLLTWGGVTDRNIPIQVFSVSSLHLTRCLRVFRMVFVQKRHLSICSHWLIMERSPNWPELGSPISKFRAKNFVGTDTDINRWTFQGDRSFGEARTSIQTFRVEDTWRDLVICSWVIWIWTFQNVWGNDVWTGVPKIWGAWNTPSRHRLRKCFFFCPHLFGVAGREAYYVENWILFLSLNS